MGRTTELRREIKNRFFPLMTAKGFSTDLRGAPFFIGFRRMTPEAIHVCDIQWEKYGRPRFVINFGRCSLAGVICHGQPTRPEDVTASATPVRGRLAPGRHSTVGGWFRQDRPLIESIVYRSRLRPPAEVVMTLLTLFHEVEDWWENGLVGPHIRISSMRYSCDAVAD
jgi:hypothetical protein